MGRRRIRKVELKIFPEEVRYGLRLDLGAAGDGEEGARIAPSSPLRRYTGAVRGLQAPHGHLPPPFRWKPASELGTAAVCAPHLGSAPGCGVPSGEVGEGPPAACWAPSRPLPTTTYLPGSAKAKARLPRAPWAPPGHWPLGEPPPSPALGRGAFQHLGQRLPGAFQWSQVQAAAGSPAPVRPSLSSSSSSSSRGGGPPLCPRTPPPPDRPLTGVGSPVAVLAVRQVVQHGGGAGGARARGWLRPSARLRRSLLQALSLARSLALGSTEAGAAVPARRTHTTTHTLAHGHTLTPARAPSQPRRCSPHPVCRRREPLAGFWGGARGREEGRKKRGRAERTPGGPLPEAATLGGGSRACRGGVEGRQEGRVLWVSGGLGFPGADAAPPAVHPPIPGRRRGRHVGRCHPAP